MSDFVICINNDSNPASLILGKVYRTLPDAEAESQNMLRIIILTFVPTIRITLLYNASSNLSGC
jgi:hypothetical protein